VNAFKKGHKPPSRPDPEWDPKAAFLEWKSQRGSSPAQRKEEAPAPIPTRPTFTKPKPASAPFPPPNSSWVAIDFETANAARSSACALGVAVVTTSGAVHSKAWLIKPPTLDFNPYNIMIHNITPDMVRTAPTLADLWPEIGPLLEGRTAVAHNAAFDFSVLRSTLDTYALPYPNMNYHCTVGFAKRAWPDLHNHKLSTMCDHLKIPLNHHDPESDARASAHIALKCAQNLGEHSPEGVAKALQLKTGALWPGSYEPAGAR
jgi:DNA polymerase-3 subunit epsilon